MEEIIILLEKFKKTAENPKEAAESITKSGKKICRYRISELFSFLWKKP